MTDVLPTVKVVNLALPTKFMIINRSELTDDHQLWPGEVGNPPDPATLPTLPERLIGKLLARKSGVKYKDWRKKPEAERIAEMEEAEAKLDLDDTIDPAEVLTVAKGPRGKWFLYKGGVICSDGFADEESANLHMIIVKAKE